MRLDKLWIKNFRNLKDFNIDFDEDQMTTVLIGHNGTGKSNLIEAIVIIFRDLDLGKSPKFSYDLEYSCRGHEIRVRADREKKSNHTTITVDGERISFSRFTRKSERRYLPKYVFAYYSGPSSRLESLFDRHQRKFYSELLKGMDQPLRPFFYAKPVHSQFVLLSFFSFDEEGSREFLEKYFRISCLESVLFVLKQPSWKSKKGDKRFWNARGAVQGFLNELYRHSLPPIYTEETVHPKFRETRREEHLHLSLPKEEKLKKLAKTYSNAREFFKMLESTYISELFHEVRIRVRMKNTNDIISFNELSEGEQQLLLVLGLLKFTQDEESLVLLDEPDTHLNPAWKLNYLNLLEEVVGKRKTSHVFICTHDPLVIGGLSKSQVQIFERDEETGEIFTRVPEQDPRGMGVAALLTSEFFGLSTTLDPETQRKLDKKRALYLKSLEHELTEDENEKMRQLADELGSLDFTRTIRDPWYDKFVRALMSRDEFKKQILTPEERRKQEAIAREIIDEILREENYEIH